jgi:hypothetical protein
MMFIIQNMAHVSAAMQECILSVQVATGSYLTLIRQNQGISYPQAGRFEGLNLSFLRVFEVPDHAIQCRPS